VTSFSQTSFSHKLIHLPQPQDGPVAITYEFEVDRIREDEFMELMRQVRLIHLRNGAFSWRLHEDLTRFNIFRVEMMVPSWTQHVLQRERMTKAEKNIIERAKNLHIGEGRVQERIYLCVNKERNRLVRLLTQVRQFPIVESYFRMLGEAGLLVEPWWKRRDWPRSGL